VRVYVRTGFQQAFTRKTTTTECLQQLAGLRLACSSKCKQKLSWSSPFPIELSFAQTEFRFDSLKHSINGPMSPVCLVEVLMWFLRINFDIVIVAALCPPLSPPLLTFHFLSLFLSVIFYFSPYALFLLPVLRLPSFLFYFNNIFVASMEFCRARRFPSALT